MLQGVVLRFRDEDGGVVVLMGWKKGGLRLPHKIRGLVYLLLGETVSN